MTTLIALLAVAANLAAAAAFYLAAPHQAALPAPLPARIGWTGGLAGLILAVVLFRQVAGPAASIFIVMTLTMAVWSLAPIAVALLRRKGSGS